MELGVGRGTLCDDVSSVLGRCPTGCRGDADSRTYREHPHEHAWHETFLPIHQCRLRPYKQGRRSRNEGLARPRLRTLCLERLQAGGDLPVAIYWDEMHTVESFRVPDSLDQLTCDRHAGSFVTANSANDGFGDRKLGDLG